MWCGGEYFRKNSWEELLKSSMEETENLPTSLKCRHVVSGKRLLEEFLEGAAEIFHWRIRKSSDVIGLFRPGFLKVCFSLIQFYLISMHVISREMQNSFAGEAEIFLCHWILLSMLPQGLFLLNLSLSITKNVLSRDLLTYSTEEAENLPLSLDSSGKGEEDQHRRCRLCLQPLDWRGKTLWWHSSKHDFLITISK